MASCDVAMELAANPCFCAVTHSALKLAKLSLLCQIYAALSGVNCDVQQVLVDSACWCGVTHDPYEMAFLQLLCNISQVTSGGGGAFGQILLYTGTNPTTDGIVPANVNRPAIAVKPSSTTYVWDPTNHVWT